MSVTKLKAIKTIDSITRRTFIKGPSIMLQNIPETLSNVCAFFDRHDDDTFEWEREKCGVKVGVRSELMRKMERKHNPTRRSSFRTNDSWFSQLNIKAQQMKCRSSILSRERERKSESSIRLVRRIERLIKNISLGQVQACVRVAGCFLWFFMRRLLPLLLYY